MTELMRETDKQLKDMAERLRLCMLRDNMSELMNMATERRLSPRELLMFLFNKEIEQREVNRIRLTTMGAHFPRLCSLESFDASSRTRPVKRTKQDGMVGNGRKRNLCRASRSWKNTPGNWTRKEGY